MKYKMKLKSEPFIKIANGNKTIELRLNDEKRQLLKIGDTIEFTNLENGETLCVQIKELIKYPSFEELYKHVDKLSIGYQKDEPANPNDMDKYYSKEEQQRYGVVGIKIKRIEDKTILKGNK